MAGEPDGSGGKRYEIRLGDGKLLFGMLAGKMDLVSRGQIEDSLKTQKEYLARGVKKRIAQIFIDKGYLNEESAKGILAAQRDALPKEKEKTPYADLAAMYGFVKRDLAEVAAREFAASGGDPEKIPAYFLEKGLVTEEQNRILAVAKRRISGKNASRTRLLAVRECPECYEAVPKNMSECPHCGKPLGETARSEDEDTHVLAMAEVCPPGESRVKCPACKMAVPEGAIDCPYCGTELEDESPRAEAPAKDSGPIFFIAVVVAAIVIAGVVALVLAARSLGRGTIECTDPNALVNNWLDGAHAALVADDTAALKSLIAPRILAEFESDERDAILRYLLARGELPPGAEITYSTEHKSKLTTDDVAFVWIDFTIKTPAEEIAHTAKWRIERAGNAGNAGGDGVSGNARSKWYITDVSIGSE